MTACQRWALPNAEFYGLWESLVYEEGMYGDGDGDGDDVQV